MKPSERVANTPTEIAKLLNEIGLPKGVVNIVNGGFDITKKICKHPDIKV